MVNTTGESQSSTRTEDFLMVSACRESWEHDVNFLKINRVHLFRCAICFSRSSRIVCVLYWQLTVCRYRSYGPQKQLAADEPYADCSRDALSMRSWNSIRVKNFSHSRRCFCQQYVRPPPLWKAIDHIHRQSKMASIGRPNLDELIEIAGQAPQFAETNFQHAWISGNVETTDSSVLRLALWSVNPYYVQGHVAQQFALIFNFE